MRAEIEPRTERRLSPRRVADAGAGVGTEVGIGRGNGAGNGSGAGYRGIDDPRISVADALRRHWLAAIMLCLLVVSAATAYGLIRSPEYEAETRLSVGRVGGGIPASALAGFTSATSALAETYSRTVRGDEVTRAVARKLDTSQADVKAALSAAPVPETPVFTITATSESSPSRARELSVLAAETLAHRIERETTGEADFNRVFERYRIAAQEESLARERYEFLEEIDASASKVAAARTELETASLNAEALRQGFLLGRQNQTETAEVEIIERASAASSDRVQVLQLLLFGGLVAGCLLGAAAAYGLATRDRRRSLAH